MTDDQLPIQDARVVEDASANQSLSETQNSRTGPEKSTNFAPAATVATQFHDTRPAAIKAAEHGLRVFKIPAGTKEARTKAFYDVASNDPERVKRMFSDGLDDEPSGDSIAVSTGDGRFPNGDGLLVVDVDNKGEGTVANLKAFSAACGLPDSLRTWMFTTPSGGIHLYFRTKPGVHVGQRLNLAGLHVDIKGYHGYVVGPGSWFEGKPYAEIKGCGFPDREIAYAPEALLDFIGAGSTPARLPPVEVTDEYEDDWSIAQARAYLPTAEPEAGDGNRHQPLNRIAHRLFEWGITPNTAIDLVAELWPEEPALTEPLDYQITTMARSRALAGKAWGIRHPKFVSEVFEQVADGQSDLPVVRACDFSGKPVPPRRWLVSEMISASTVTLFSGDGGGGKTTIMLQLAVAVVAAREWFGVSPETGPVLVISAEDDISEMHRRVVTIASQAGIELSELGGLHLISLADGDAVMAAAANAAGTISPTGLWRKVGALVRQIKPRLVVLDTLADVFAGNENARGEARQFIGILRRLAIEHELAVLLLAHPSLSGLASGSGTSGSTGWSNSVRSRLYLEQIKTDGDREVDPDLRKLSVKKSNYGPAGLEFRIRWQSGCFIVDGVSARFDKAAADDEAERVFLNLLSAFERQGRDVSPNPSRSYAPTVFASHPDARGFGKKAFEGAINRLLADGRIRVDKFGPPSRQRTRVVIGRNGAEP